MCVCVCVCGSQCTCVCINDDITECNSRTHHSYRIPIK